MINIFITNFILLLKEISIRIKQYLLKPFRNRRKKKFKLNNYKNNKMQEGNVIRKRERKNLKEKRILYSKFRNSKSD